MKLRFFQNQEKRSVYIGGFSREYKELWVNTGAPVLQYQEEEEGDWYDVPYVNQAEEGIYDGEWD